MDKIPTKSMPRNAFVILPWPPERLVPPKSTAVITSSGVFIPIRPDATFNFDANMTPANPESSPVIAKQ